MMLAPWILVQPPLDASCISSSVLRRETKRNQPHDLQTASDFHTRYPCHRYLETVNSPPRATNHCVLLSHTTHLLAASIKALFLAFRWDLDGDHFPPASFAECKRAHSSLSMCFAFFALLPASKSISSARTNCSVLWVCVSMGFLVATRIPGCRIAGAKPWRDSSPCGNIQIFSSPSANW